MAKIVAISDTHGRYLDVPPAGDVLIIAGDVLLAGSLREYRIFYEWLGRIRNSHRFTEIIFVPGNHDIYVEENEPLVREELRSNLNIHMLIDQEITAKVGEESLRIYGTPWVPQIGVFKRWAYEIPRLTSKLEDRWNNIPPSLDILVTHGPPHMHLDNIYLDSGFQSPNWGCELLRNRLDELNREKSAPRFHIFGHVHDPVGGKEAMLGSTKLLNVAVCDEDYGIGFEPTVFLTGTD